MLHQKTGKLDRCTTWRSSTCTKAAILCFMTLLLESPALCHTHAHKYRFIHVTCQHTHRTSHSHRAVRHTHNTCLNVLSAAAAAGGDKRPVNVAAAGSQRRADWITMKPLTATQHDSQTPGGGSGRPSSYKWHPLCSALISFYERFYIVRDGATSCIYCLSAVTSDLKRAC